MSESSASTASDVEKKPPKTPQSTQMHPVLWVAFIACIVSSPFLFGFDLLVVGTIQPSILQDLGHVDKLTWISVSYALTAMGTTLLWGRLYDLFNVKWVFLAAVVLFEAGSILSGAAPDLNSLIGGRALSGLGAIGTYMGAMTTLTLVTTIEQRPLYFSFITVAYGIGTVVAPVIGGAFADSSATWRWGFYINACICGLFAPGYLWLFPSKRLYPAGTPLLTRLQGLDVLGNVLWCGASASLLMAISFGGAVYAWNSGQTIALFVCTGVLWILFIVQQWTSFTTTPARRIFPVAFLSSFELNNLFIQTATSTAVANVPIFLIPIYFQFVHHDSAITAGLHVLLIVALRSVFILANGFFMKKTGVVMPWFVGGAAFCLAGTAPFLVARVDTSASVIYGLTVIIGAGVGMYNQASFSVAQARSKPELAPLATVFIMVGQVFGLAVCLAVANSIFYNQAAALISHAVPGLSVQALQQAIDGGMSAQILANADPAKAQAITAAINEALNRAWASVVAAAAVSLILACFLKRERLFR